MDIQPNTSSTTHHFAVEGSSMMPGLHTQIPLYQPEIGLVQNVKFTIEGNQNSINFTGVLNVSDEQYWFEIIAQNIGNATKQNSKVITVQYRSTETIGTNGNSLIIFVNSEKKQADEGEQDEQQEELSTSDEVIHLINSQMKGNFCLQGLCTLMIEFKNKETMQKAYDLMSLYVGEEDEGNSEYQDDELMQEMISADNIDENGNIILNQQQSQQQQQQDDDNQMMEDETEQKK